VARRSNGIVPALVELMAQVVPETGRWRGWYRIVIGRLRVQLVPSRTDRNEVDNCGIHYAVRRSTVGARSMR